MYWDWDRCWARFWYWDWVLGLGLGTGLGHAHVRPAPAIMNILFYFIFQKRSLLSLATLRVFIGKN